jgi:predicted nucleic acid-binding protein
VAEGPPVDPTSPVVLDTDILVWYFRGNERARRFLEAIPYPDRTLSALTRMELIQGCRNRAEMARVKAFTSANFSVVFYPDESTIHRATRLLEEHALPDGLRVVDALLAASALNADCAFATANVRHYRPIKGLRLIEFRPDR